jgi:chromosome segregation ATPase
MNTKLVTKPVEQSTQPKPLKEDLQSLTEKIMNLQSILDSQAQEIITLEQLINDNYADLSSQIDDVETLACDAHSLAAEAHDGSGANESNLEDLESTVEDLSSSLQSLESDIQDIILTGNDE